MSRKRIRLFVDIYPDGANIIYMSETNSPEKRIMGRNFSNLSSLKEAFIMIGLNPLDISDTNEAFSISIEVTDGQLDTLGFNEVGALQAN